MPSALHILLFVGVIIALASGKSRHQTHPMLGHNQKEYAALLNSVAEGKWKPYQSFEYNSDYRPPSSSEDGSPNPTVIKVSFKDLEVKTLNLTEPGKEKIEVEGIFVREHKDSRLQFSPVQGDDRDFIRTDYGGANINIWKPSITSMIVDEFDPHYWREGIHDITLFNHKGEVFVQKRVEISLKAPAVLSSDKKTSTFSLQMTEKSLPVEDVILEWKSENPITVKDGASIVKSVSGEMFKFTPSIGKCKRVESYGPFGEQEYTCVKLDISFERLG